MTVWLCNCFWRDQHRGCRQCDIVRIVTSSDSFLFLWDTWLKETTVVTRWKKILCALLVIKQVVALGSTDPLAIHALPPCLYKKLIPLPQFLFQFFHFKALSLFLSKRQMLSVHGLLHFLIKLSFFFGNLLLWVFQINKLSLKFQLI